MIRIAILAALPQEYQPFRKLIPSWQFVRRKPFRTLAHSMPEKELFVVETGMGEKPVQKAVQWIFQTKSPDFLLSIGFAGSLSKSLSVGDVLWGQRYVLHESFSEKNPSSGRNADPGHVTPAKPLPEADQKTGMQFSPSERVSHFCQNHGVEKVQIVTVHQPEDKFFLSHHFQNVPSIVDMESYFVAQFALAKQIPFLCFRAISDGLEDEIDFSPDQISGPDGRVRISRVLKVIAKEPRLMRSFYASWQRSREAGQRLGNVVASFVNLPLAELNEMVQFNSSKIHLISVS
jgi:nucleoside phosphorylase